MPPVTLASSAAIPIEAELSAIVQQTPPAATIQMEPQKSSGHSSADATAMKQEHVPITATNIQKATATVNAEWSKPFNCKQRMLIEIASATKIGRINTPILSGTSSLMISMKST